ncbi:unnamed protein product, partial [Scytosiphon promiscuus]
ARSGYSCRNFCLMLDRRSRSKISSNSTAFGGVRGSHFFADAIPSLEAREKENCRGVDLVRTRGRNPTSRGFRGVTFVPPVSHAFACYIQTRAVGAALESRERDADRGVSYLVDLLQQQKKKSG